MNTAHGSPWDRGAADSHYRRPRNPHRYEFGAQVNYTLIPLEYLSEQEIYEYHAGYDWNDLYGDKKDYGNE